jgi:hypothetical protein
MLSTILIGGLSPVRSVGRTAVFWDNARAESLWATALFDVQILAGYITTDTGRHLVFDLSMSGRTYPEVLTKREQANDDVGIVAAQIPAVAVEMTRHRSRSSAT